MQNVAIAFACFYAGVLANIECPPPEEQTNPSYLCDPEDCYSYYECDNGVPVHVTCPGGLVWNQVDKTCDFEWRTPCLTPTLPLSTESFSHDQDLPTSLLSSSTNAQCNIRFLQDETDYRKYYECVNGTFISKTCPDGLEWDSIENICDFSWYLPKTKSLPTIEKFEERDLLCPPPSNTRGNFTPTYHPDDTNCHKYFECDNGVLKSLTCPHNLVWSQDLLSCDHEWNTPCTTERIHHHKPDDVSITRKSAEKETVRRHFMHKLGDEK